MKLQPGKNRVSFKCEDKEIAALLFLPKEYDNTKAYPAIAVTPPVTGVKEQTAGLYAEELSKYGFVVVTFDPRGFGESEGTRFVANPYNIIEDTRTAVSYLRSLDCVNQNQIFITGICIGAPIAAVAAVYDSRVKALAVVSAFADGHDITYNLLGAEGMRNLLFTASGESRDALFQRNENIMNKTVPETDEEVKAMPNPVVLGMRDYYLAGMPGDVPNWHNAGNALSNEFVMSFSVFHHVHMFEAIPTFHAYGSEAVTRDGSERFYNEVKGEKERMIIEGEGHFDLYWKPNAVVPISDGIAKFFKKQIS